MKTEPRPMFMVADDLWNTKAVLSGLHAKLEGLIRVDALDEDEGNDALRMVVVCGDRLAAVASELVAMNGTPAAPAGAVELLRQIDGWLANTGHDLAHPWRISIGAFLATPAVQGQAPEAQGG